MSLEPHWIWDARWKEQTARTPEQNFPERYRHFTERWEVAGFLEFDACWVSADFYVLVGTPEHPAPHARSILLAFEHEAKTYNAARGTDVTSARLNNERGHVDWQASLRRVTRVRQEALIRRGEGR